MPSSSKRSAPAENASLPEVTTTPLTAASAEVCFTMSSSSVMVVSSSTFMERPGMSHVTSAMPSASFSILKFLKAMLLLPIRSLRRVGKGALRVVPTIYRLVIWNGGHRGVYHRARIRATHWLCPPYESNSFDDRRRPHAAADAQRDQRGRLVGALEFIEHGAENHRARCAERMAERDGAAVDVDLGIVDVERLDVTQHHRGEGFVQFEQVDIRLLHAGALEQFFGDVDRTGQHHRRLRADVGKGADFCPRLQAVLGTGLLAAEQNRAGAVDNPGGIAGMMHVVDALDFRMRLDRDRVETAHLPDRHERRLQRGQRLHRRR